MAYIEGHAREQALAAAGVDSGLCVGGSPVRFVDAFVDDLDLGKAGFVRAQSKATGRPGYDPADMLKLYLYGYLDLRRAITLIGVQGMIRSAICVDVAPDMLPMGPLRRRYSRKPGFAPSL